MDVLSHCELLDPLQDLVFGVVQFHNILLLELLQGDSLSALLGYFGGEDVLVYEAARLHDIEDPDNVIVWVVGILLLDQQNGVEGIEDCDFVGYSVQFIDEPVVVAVEKGNVVVGLLSVLANPFLLRTSCLSCLILTYGLPRLYHVLIVYDELIVAYLNVLDLIFHLSLVGFAHCTFAVKDYG